VAADSMASPIGMSAIGFIGRLLRVRGNADPPETSRGVWDDPSGISHR
jgi:hypothetical protein